LQNYFQRKIIKQKIYKETMKAVFVLILIVLLVGCAADTEIYAQDFDDPILDNQEKNEEKNEEIETHIVQQTSADCDTVLPFHYPPVNLDKVEHIDPLGDMVGNHVTPIDHQYYIGKEGFEGPIDIEVYAPAAGKIISIQHMGSFALAGEGREHYEDYRVVLDHGCGLQTIYIHIDQLNPKIVASPPQPGEYSSFNIAVEAGDIIGWYGGSVDYQVMDESVELDYVSPELYEGEAWKIHTPDPFPYFRDDIRDQLESLSLRREEPLGGFIMYDLPGTLTGNWFVEGSNGYAGNSNDYWETHLAVVYNNVDTDFIIVSLGEFNGEPHQFGVLGNTPDPATVGIGDIVKYELVRKEFYRTSTNERWMWGELAYDVELRAHDGVEGVVLFEVLPDEQLKVEVFESVTGDEVDGFVNPVIYER
jgi:hypothetical protein